MTSHQAQAELVLPPAWTPPPRPAVPILAATVPILGAFALWLVTGSVLSLWLAALGPLIAVATTLDAARAARTGRRRAEAEAAEALDRVSAAIAARHRDERERLWGRHPDIASTVCRDGEIWRAVPGRASALVVGRGDAASDVRVTGGDGDPAAAAIRARATVVGDAPVIVPAAGGVAVVGAPVVAAAVARGLALQLCLALPPGELRVVGPARGETAWTEHLPHRRAATGLALALLAPGDPVPVGADVVIARADAQAVPPRCAALLTVVAPGRAQLDHGGETRGVEVEAVGELQAESLAADLAERAERVLGLAADRAAVTFHELLAAAPAPRRGGLPAVVGASRGEASVIDLVADGPHAVVAGVTGSGKSELLITWVLALCATHSTREVSFLLADFKGGTAFDALAALPHVTGVITDLDGSGARRALESLRAEVRWREAELARAGARDILDERVDLPRLVVVVDEFAALLGEHPELHAVFADVAARGRALGMHLVLGTQRVSGVVRDALLANCPLRLSLRVTDTADSRVVVGTDEAALLAGGAEGAGIALVRRAQDASPQRVRIGLSTTADVARIAAASTGPLPRRPWLPDLPRRVDLERLRPAARDELVLGLADEPERQCQEPCALRVEDRGILVAGGSGSGKTTALETLAAQAPETVVHVPADGEGAWDAVALLVEDPPPPGTVIVVDDLDALASRLPGEYAQAVTERLERIVRGAGDAGVLVAASAQRLTGAAARIADLLPRRLLLATPSRAEHVALGGDPGHYAPGAPPGRGRLDGRAVQVAVAEAAVRPALSVLAEFVPAAGLIGLVARRVAARDVVARWRTAGLRVMGVDEAALLGDPAVLAAEGAVVVGDPDEWQRAWRLLGAVRDEQVLVIDAGCAPEYRIIAADRALPPYCESGRRRAWLIRAGGPPERIVLPAPMR